MTTTQHPVNGRLAYYPNDPPGTLDRRTDERLDIAPQRGRDRARLCWCGAEIDWTGPLGPRSVLARALLRSRTAPHPDQLADARSRGLISCGPGDKGLG